jgi:hypothetical protein
MTARCMLYMVRLGLQAENFRRQRAAFLPTRLPQFLLDRGEALGAAGGRGGPFVVGHAEGRQEQRACCPRGGSG